MPDYEDYAKDETSMRKYVGYQARYTDEPRESDKILISKAVEAGGADVLDIGCSTGNLLHHLRRAMPDARLVGGEISDVQLDTCRNDPRLDGIAFEHMDATDLGVTDAFDIIIANATLCVLDPESYAKAVDSIATALRPGGTLLAFDWYHPWPHDLEITERSKAHPDGMTLRFRSYTTVELLLNAAGFAKWMFSPFEIPIDLDGSPVGDNADGYQDLVTRTVRDDGGRRLQFRGTLYQPWCHLEAHKPAASSHA